MPFSLNKQAMFFQRRVHGFCFHGKPSSRLRPVGSERDAEEAVSGEILSTFSRYLTFRGKMYFLKDFQEVT